MAGTDADFDPDEFRDGIRSAITMGLPVLAAQRPTFHWDTVRVYDADDLDVSGAPRDWSAVPVSVTTRTPVQKTVQVITKGGGAELFTSIGEINEDEAVVMMFDEEYAVVGDFDEVVLGNNVYRRVKEFPQLALFDVAIHMVLVRARDES